MASKSNFSSPYDTLRLLFDTVIAFMFWNLLHALAPMIWFYPLNALDITGYEVFCLVCFSPCILLSGEKVRKLFKHDVTMQIILLLMLGGCASFQCSTTLSRLIILSVGVAAALLLPALTLWYSNHVNKVVSFWGYVLAFMALLSSRVWYTSITPLWNDYKTNTVLVTVFSIVVFSKVFFQYNQDPEVSSGKAKQSTSKVQSSATTKSENSQSTKKDVTRNESCVMQSLGLGGFIVIMHTVFGEISVPSRYVIQSYPNTGPMPNPWGGLILLGLTLGLFLSMHSSISNKYLWSLLGFASSMGLMFLPGWYGYLCGVFLAIYMSSIWSVIWENAIDCGKPGKTLCIAVLVYLLSIFGLVWCTAYNFVPFGGEYSRERTYVVIGLDVLLIGWSATRGSSRNTKLGFALNLPDMKYYTASTKTTPVSTRQAFGKTVKKCLFIIALVGLLGFEYRNRFPRKVSPLYTNSNATDEKHVSALIWTFHFGYDNVGWPSLERAADTLEKTGADVITLLESDASKPYLGNNDIAMWLSERLNMYVDFGPSTRDHTWGNLLLSRYPIVKSQHHLLPSPYGELAPAVSATVNVTGSLVDFVVTHMGNDRDDLDRQLQAKSLADLCANSENPVVFLGYVTSKPGGRDYQKLVKDGRMKDIDPTDKSRFCEYILYRDLVRIGYARISHGGLSDTELQMARWQIVSKSSQIKDRPSVSKDQDSVPESLRFGDDFGTYFDNHYWGNSHHYHMSTPKYFTV